MTPHGTESLRRSCPSLARYPPVGKCAIRNQIEGITYPTGITNMNEGRVPVNVPLCHPPLDYVIKGGLNVRTWFSLRKGLQQIKFSIRFWSDKVPAKIMLQFRRTPDFQDAGIDLAISNNILKDSFLRMSELRLGHTPFITAFQKRTATNNKYIH